MKIIDCTTYYSEDLMLDIRFNILNENVHKFIVTESKFSHSGKEKKLNFNINNFPKFKDKIKYIIIDEPPSNLLELKDEDTEEKRGEKLILNGMARDYFQRENLITGLKNANENDFILISDLDEIPNLEQSNLSKIKHKIIVFEQKMFYYKLNLLYSGTLWHGTKACKKKYLISPQWLRNIKAKKYPFWRVDLLFSKKYSDLFFIKNGGCILHI